VAPPVPLLELRHVTQEFGGKTRPFVAIRDLSLVLHDGEILALLGPSGCGKSTLLRIAVGLMQPTRGEVRYRGEPTRGVNPRAAMVFQTFALFPWLTVQQNVEVALEARGVVPSERSRRAIEVLDRVGLDGFESALPRELSGGMRQKTGLARAMAVEPELLCLDEPFSSLDVLSAETLRGELLELWSSGTMSTRAVLMVTHDIEEAVLMADRIAVMDKRPGRLIAEVAVGLRRPRSRKDPRFSAVVDRVYALLAGRTEPEHVELGTAPGEPGQTRALPHVTADALAGLLEEIAERPGRQEDIFRLAADLRLGSDDLLGLADAGELLGFVHVQEGDARLKEIGERFARADILERKEIFRDRLERVPLVRWLLGLLGASASRAIERGVAEAALELDFSPEDARRQIDTLVRWGRYAELVEYDDRSGVLRLAPEATRAGGAAEDRGRPAPGGA
jgi:NitT/TauT family transport system ATP-binding protein